MYRALVDLELESTFAFQDGQWLADVAPTRLTAEQHRQLPQAKRRAAQRTALDAQIPRHLYYVKQKPLGLPTHAEARRLAAVRRQMGELMHWTLAYTDADAISARYAALLNCP